MIGEVVSLIYLGLQNETYDCKFPEKSESPSKEEAVRNQVQSLIAKAFVQVFV